jgi:hypothetical protein
MAQALEVYVGEKFQQEPLPNYFMPSQLWHTSILFLQRHKVLVACSLGIIVVLVVFIPKKFWLPTSNSATSQLNVRRAELERRLDALNRNDNNNQPALEAALQSQLLREDGEMQKLVIPKNINLIRLKLQLPQGTRYEKYGASVQPVGRDEPFKVKELKTDATGAVVLILTVDAVPAGDYQIQLLGGTSEPVTSKVALYNLRIIHET